MRHQIFTPNKCVHACLSTRVRNRLAELIEPPKRGDTAMRIFVSKGLRLSTFKALLTEGYEWPELAWIMSKRALLQRANNADLTIAESAKMFRLLRVHVLAVEVFGCNEKAIAWMRSPQKTFNSLNALEIVSMECGGPIVEELLYGIDEGYY